MHGVPLPQSCSSAKAESMAAKGEAVWVETESKPTIQLTKPWSPKGMFYRWRENHMQTIDQALAKLQTSRFRAKFHLTQKDRDYITEKGMDTIRSHAENFIATRLAPSEIPNDGKQTPMRGHPVFLAQHACACCCRGCLEKWYRIPKGRELTEDQQRRIVNLLMTWICREYEKTGGFYGKEKDRRYADFGAETEKEDGDRHD